MTVSSEVFERIAKAAVASRAASEKLFHGPQKVIIKGKVYYSQTISFYENDEFDYALGCATIFFDEEGVPVGPRRIFMTLTKQNIVIPMPRVTPHLWLNLKKQI
ncbi:hypothetical protein NIB75_10445 [Bacteroides uniformis]|nr:hypothetical protein [Bacteroides uniformis]